MNRLTKDDVKQMGMLELSHNQVFVKNREAWYRDFILSNIKTLSSELNNAFEELKEYRRLEEQGLLIKLPCKVGDTVYQIMYDRTIENYKVVGFEIDEREKLYVRVLIERPAATISKEDLYFLPKKKLKKH